MGFRNNVKVYWKIFRSSKNERAEWIYIYDALHKMHQEQNPHLQQSAINEAVIQRMLLAIKLDYYKKNLRTEIDEWAKNHPEFVPLHQKIDPALAGVNPKPVTEKQEAINHKEVEDMLSLPVIDESQLDENFELFKTASLQQQQQFYREFLKKYHQPELSDKEKTETEYYLNLMEKYFETNSLPSSEAIDDDEALRSKERLSEHRQKQKEKKKYKL